MGVPVTVLSGTLGAGKTTLLNHVLTGNHDYEAAVLVNDMGEINVDAELVKRRVENDREVVELSNGCICCGIQGEFEQAITDLAFDEEFDYLLVEPSGISEPAPVARQFVRSHAATFYELSSVVTVVDAKQVSEAFGEGNAERRGVDGDGNRPLSDLIVEGIEFCDTLVVNKTDLVDEEELDGVLKTLRALQPNAELLTTEFGQVDPNEILDTHRFDVETVSDAASWKRTLKHHRNHDEGEENADGSDSAHEHDHESDDHGRGDHGHEHPPAVYGVDSFVYERRRPLHPARLVNALREPPVAVVRAKGFIHVANRPDHALTLSLAGNQTHVEVAGRWIASLPEDRRERYRTRENDWDETYGDRKTELVVIGREMETAGIERIFDNCVLTDTELNTDYNGFENPFPTQEGADVQL